MGTGRAWTGRGPRRRSEGKKTGPNPTARAQGGGKRSLWTEGHGVPMGLVVEGAHRQDRKRVRSTLDSRVVARPAPTAEPPQGRCWDKGYDEQAVRAIVAECGCTAPRRSRGRRRRRSQPPQARKLGAGWGSARTRG
jgi:putative transposase